MELQKFSQRPNEMVVTSTASAVAEEVFVRREMELLIGVACFVTVILVVVIVWLAYKVFDCGHISNSSRSSSRSSLYSNNSDSPYQWRTMSTIVATTHHQGGPIYVIKQNKAIQRLLNIRSTDNKGTSSEKEAVIRAPLAFI